MKPPLYFLMFLEDHHYKIAKDLHSATFPNVDIPMIKRILSLNFSSENKKKFDSVVEAYVELFDENWLSHLGERLDMESYLEIHNLVTFKTYYKKINVTNEELYGKQP